MKLFVVLFIPMLAISCATSYHPQNLLGEGYSSLAVGPDAFQVHFKGNGNTSPERAHAFALLRSADLTLEHGFRYFQVVEHSATLQNDYSITGKSRTTLAGTTATTRTNSSISKRSKPRESFTIICFKEKPDDFSYDAQFLAKSIRQKYGVDR